MSKKTIIVIPGLGEENALNVIRRIVSRWNDDGHQVYVFDSSWEQDESFESKRQRLLDFFDRHSTEETYLVAYSAGGALANVLFNLRPGIKRVILIASKLKGSVTIGPVYTSRVPSLLPAVQLSEEYLDVMPTDLRDKLVCMMPLYEGVVPKIDMTIPGATVKTILFISHSLSIVFALLFQVKKQLKNV